MDPYILNRSGCAPLPAQWPTRRAHDKLAKRGEWAANRLMFAHDNAIENLVIFARLVLILNAIDYSSKWTVLACAVYSGPASRI